MDFSAMSPARRCWILFFEFFKIALFVVGGGLAIMAAADDIFVRKYKLLRDGELSDMLAIIQVVPGLVAGNVAIYVGYRAAGFAGAFSSLLGVAAPSYCVISLVALGFYSLPMHNAWLQGAFLGVRTAMVGLMLVMLMRIWRSSIRCKWQLALFVIGVLGILVFHWNPGWLIAGALLFGIVYCMVICRELPAAALEEKTTSRKAKS